MRFEHGDAIERKMTWVVAVLGFALLMIVHEAGHLLAARAFGMRVIRFSIGFGPAIWRYQPKGSDTVYQLALIPFLAYVQIAGMNPLEEADPDDAGSFANASLVGRITAIVAGPLANYLFASVLFFFFFLYVPTTQIFVLPGGAAETASMRDGDVIVAIEGKEIKEWDDLRETIIANPKKPLSVKVLREEKPVTLTVTPEAKGEKGEGFIGVQPDTKMDLRKADDAAIAAIAFPAEMIAGLVTVLARAVTFQEKPQVSGPVGILKEMKKAVDRGWSQYLYLIAFLSVSLAGINLVPFPGLDGGRLAFLTYEAVTRRRPNAKIEAHIHAVGILMLLALIVVLSVQGR